MSTGDDRRSAPERDLSDEEMMEEIIKKAEILIDALPYIRNFCGKTFVIKYGGAAQTRDELKESFAKDVVMLNFIGIRTVIVHGGGKEVTDIAGKLGLESRFVNGQRYTDDAMMEVVQMVLAGGTNSGSPMWCRASFCHTTCFSQSTNSSSLAPARNFVRRSCSVTLKRQVRILPSAVKRMRLQWPQNGSVTGAMMPISAFVPGKPHRTEVEEGLSVFTGCKS